MRSMTGYGRGEHSEAGTKVTVELKAVNRKQAEVVLRLPRELEALETRVREEVNRVVARGRVEVLVSLEQPGEAQAAKINHQLAATYAWELRGLANQLGLTGGVTLDVLVRCPGVIETNREAPEAESRWPLVEPALRSALSAFNGMRDREGEALAADLALRVANLGAAVARVRTHSPEVLKRFREQLLQRIRIAGLENVSAEDERVIKEVVFFSDRSDISEELARLESHFGQFADCQKSAEPVGRKLDFLAQEMNREINTIGSKANDALISADVVLLKTELERFREQAQNVE
ncbi:MAG TPA: YicC/YloC family endoribonuclease [Candidatus Limnocylindria bacterium]|nr:YicC/YloC family endoribonuclease [Candidatus Limnocylindria bacterium]